MTEPTPHGALRLRLVESLVAAVGRAERHEKPFFHALMRDAIPRDAHDLMRASLPDPALYSPDNPEKYRLPDGLVARSLLPLDDEGLAPVPEPARAVWREVSAALASVELRRAVFTLLGPALARRFHVPLDRLDEIEAYPRPSLIRDLPGYWIEPHPDSPHKAVTFQLSLPAAGASPGLGMSFYRLRPWQLLRTGRLLQEFRRARFEPGAACTFAVGRTSWHGVERIPAEAGVRDTILLIYFRDPLRRR